MRTAESIEAQSEIAANQKEPLLVCDHSGNPHLLNSHGDNCPCPNSVPVSESKETENSKSAPWLKPYHFQPGKSGNPAGRPKRDVASDVARKVFENNEEAVYEALGKALLKGNAYAFTQLAERGYGKLKEKLEVSGLDSVAEKLAAARKRRAK